MRPVATSLTVVIVVVLIAGCGSSGKPGGSGNSHQGSTSTATHASTSGRSLGSSVASFAQAGNCAQIAGIGSKFAQAMQAATSHGRFNVHATVTAYRSLADAAPAAIQPDLRVLANALSSFATDLNNAHLTVGKVPSASQLVDAS